MGLVCGALHLSSVSMRLGLLGSCHSKALCTNILSISFTYLLCWNYYVFLFYFASSFLWSTFSNSFPIRIHRNKFSYHFSIIFYLLSFFLPCEQFFSTLSCNPSEFLFCCGILNFQQLFLIYSFFQNIHRTSTISRHCP